MKIGIIQASTQIDKNDLIFNMTKQITSKYGYEVINFGVFENEEEVYSYTEIALLTSLLLSSKSVDFVITGCSSGQGMNMACNSLPNVLCGFIQNPQDAFLFGRINDGNAISLPLGLGFGWLGELNLEYSLEKLFDGEFGIGYPEEVAERKIKETQIVKMYIIKNQKSHLLNF
ncbi:RpiB/LacA/LacB family sugar-phosphate isomerase [Streptococcus parauberis]|nr:RpiB/LacA/LacB family sugar-phosphate isomerase [Streptococcus parauberis]